MSPELIFVDTNVFLRYLTNDVPYQADAFERLLRRAAAGEISLLTSAVALAEIVWTLESYYHLEKNTVQKHILAILNTPGLDVPEGELVLQAIIGYVDKNVDFIDAFHAAWMTNQGVRIACTLDQKHFSRFEDITVIAPDALT